jgi:hypothetical protein
MRKIIIIIAICISFAISAVFILSFLSGNLNDYLLTRQGNGLVQRIEVYRSKHHELPDKLEDVGVHVTDDFPLFYRKQSHDVYLLWFGTGVGRSKTYHSDQKKWFDEN